MFSGKYSKTFAPRDIAREGPKAKPEVPPGRSPSPSLFAPFQTLLLTTYGTEWVLIGNSLYTTLSIHVILIAYTISLS